MILNQLSLLISSRTSTRNNYKNNHLFIFLFLWCCCCICAVSSSDDNNNNVYANYDRQQQQSTTTSDEQHIGGHDNNTEELLVLSTSIVNLLFAICLSILTVCVCYFAIREYYLIHQYHKNGQEVEGRIVVVNNAHNSNDFIEQNSTTKVNPNRNYNAYYEIVTVDYEYIDRSGYSSTIRKRIQCTSTDIYKHSDEESPCELVQVQFDRDDKDRENNYKNENNNNNRVVDNDMENNRDDRQQFSFTQMTFESPQSHFSYVKLLLLEEYPQSGLSKNFLRVNNVRKQIPILCFIAFLGILTEFCMYLGLQAIVESRSVRFQQSMFLTLALLVVGLLCSHLGFGSYVTKLLHEEYFEGGEMLIKVDDSTIGTVSTTYALTPKDQQKQQHRYHGGSSSITREISSISVQ